MIRPMVDCGVISKETGQWEGVPTDDPQMTGITTALGVANGAETLVPDTNEYPSIDMTGFTDIFIAMKPTNAGNYAISAIMGPDTQTFGGLSPIDAAANLKGAVRQSDFNNLLVDGNDSMTADKWNVFYIQDTVGGQKNMQFKISNNSGGSSDIQFAFMRRVK
jgi:hypothetical protein